MTWFLIWLIGVMVFPICIGIANRYLKIVRRYEFTTQKEIGSFIIGMIIITALWPISVLGIGLIYVGILFYKFFIPN